MRASAALPARCARSSSSEDCLGRLAWRCTPRRESVIRSIVWDLGGTLLDTYPDVDRALARAAFGDTGPDRLAQVAALTRVSSGHAIRELARLSGTPEPELRAAYEQVTRLWLEHPAPVMPGARAVMAAVTGGGGLNLVATHRDRASAEQLLTASALHVDDLVCAPDGYARKPSPEMIQVLLDRHGLAAGDAIAVGDRPVDVEAARAAGVDAVLLTSGLVDAGDLPHVSALSELLPLLG